MPLGLLFTEKHSVQANHVVGFERAHIIIIIIKSHKRKISIEFPESVKLIRKVVAREVTDSVEFLARFDEPVASISG